MHIEDNTICIVETQYPWIYDFCEPGTETEMLKKAKEGKLLGLRKEKDMLMLEEPAINGIWTLFLNDEGGIIKITLW